MKSLLLRWLSGALALLLVSQLPLGIEVRGVAAAFLAALVLGLANLTVRPLILLLTLPLNLVTFGLFTFVVNALVLLLVAWVVPGFTVHGFWWAVPDALLIGLVARLIRTLLGVVLRG